MAASKSGSSAAKKAAEQKKTYYVGPSIPRLGLLRNTNYEEIPAAALQEMENTRILKALFIDLLTYPKVHADIEAGKKNTRDGGFYFQTFNAVAAKFGVPGEGRLRGGDGQ